MCISGLSATYGEQPRSGRLVEDPLEKDLHTLRVVERNADDCGRGNLRVYLAVMSLPDEEGRPRKQAAQLAGNSDPS